MPNWCQNFLIVKGNRKVLDDFKKYVKIGKDDIRDVGWESKETALSLEKCIEMPKELRGTKAPPDKPNPELIDKYGADNWYDWRNENWSVKWDITAELTNETSRSLWYCFDSPWCPPMKAIQNLSKKFTELDFTLRYSESGCCFRGRAFISNGAVEDDCKSY